jgi:hypothetical protein
MAGASFRGPQQWQEWSQWLSQGLHGRSRWRLGVLLMGVLFANGRRCVSSWLRANGISDDYQEYYYFLAALGRKAESVASRLLALVLQRVVGGERLLAVIDDTPTKRYGPHVEGADIHHNPTPGPADQQYLYGHVWVTLSLAVRHSLWGTIALPLRALLYVRQRTLEKIPRRRGWRFRTKLELAAELLGWWANIAKLAGKTLWMAVDGAYAKRPFLAAAQAASVTIVSRLRKDAALFDVPPPRRPGQRGRPRKYGPRISLAKRAGQTRGWKALECVIYGQPTWKLFKTFLAAYPPAGGLIRVVIVLEESGSVAYFFCTDPNASVRDILEAFADRAAIEQDFHDLKEVWGAGQQQVRNIWTNVGVYHMCLWMHTLVELWAWERPHHELCDRSDSPWDDPERRPSHANRRKAFRQAILREHLSALTTAATLPQKLHQLIEQLLNLAA